MLRSSATIPGATPFASRVVSPRSSITKLGSPSFLSQFDHAELVAQPLDRIRRKLIGAAREMPVAVLMVVKEKTAVIATGTRKNRR